MFLITDFAFYSINPRFSLYFQSSFFQSSTNNYIFGKSKNYFLNKT